MALAIMDLVHLHCSLTVNDNQPHIVSEDWYFKVAEFFAEYFRNSL